ncbi:MAG: hypothetical protein HOO96_28605, partial [Polyangiaceae bacterium]|nr:hypothetical protein [Polyangiaceae bacterium]
GKEEDVEVGATYFGARYYSPYLGRFMSADPLWIHAAGGDSNPYAYVGGMLSHATDPFGLDAKTEVKSSSSPDGRTFNESITSDGSSLESVVTASDPSPAAETEVNRPDPAPVPTPDPAPVATAERDPVRGADSKSSVEPPPWGQGPKPLSQQGWGRPPTNDQKAEAIRIGLAQGALNFIKPLWLKPVKLRGVVGRDPAETASLAKYQEAGDDGGTAFLHGLSFFVGGEIADGLGALGSRAAGAAEEAAAGGTATVFKYAGGQGGHFSVLIEAGGETIHTHQVILRNGMTTIARVEPGQLPAVAEQIQLAISNPAGAMAYQRAAIGAPGGAYNALYNNCAQHCAHVLNAGGADVPTSIRPLLLWWASQTGR